MKRIRALAGWLLAAVCLLLPAGCETESAAEGPRITPHSVSLRKGESAEFIASGGYEYTWSIENKSWALLSASAGDRVVYTSLYDPGDAEAVQTLTVTSRIIGSSSTNATNVKKAEAYIVHL
jgi:hypothetical protein